jgi:hypothetical protein
MLPHLQVLYDLGGIVASVAVVPPFACDLMVARTVSGSDWGGVQRDEDSAKDLFIVELVALLE